MLLPLLSRVAFAVSVGGGVLGVNCVVEAVYASDSVVVACVVNVTVYLLVLLSLLLSMLLSWLLPLLLLLFLLLLLLFLLFDLFCCGWCLVR